MNDTPTQSDMTDEEIVAALAEALPHEINCDGPEDSWCQASRRARASNLPSTVRRIAEQRAAEEVRDLAARFENVGAFGAYCIVRSRLDELDAAALTATPNHGRNAT